MVIESSTNSNSILSPKYLRQFLATVSVNIITLSHGIVIGWLSPTIHHLRSSNSPVNFKVNKEDVPWIGSPLGIGSLLGIILFGLLFDRIGRKICLYLMALPHIGNWICIFFADTVECLYLGRFIGGFTGGGSLVVTIIFVSEIADTRIRGRLMTFFAYALNLGMLLGFIIATFVNYHTMALAMMSIPCIYLICIAFISETPQHLLRKSKTIAAEKAFKFYKNINANSSDDDIQQFNKEFAKLQENLMEQSKENSSKFKDLFTKSALKAFFTAFIIQFLYQFSGLFAIMNYMSLIFEETGSVLEPNTSTILMGIIALIGIQGATMIVDGLGRKFLMLFSAGVVCLIQVAFGAFVYCSSEQILRKYNWVPVVFMSCLIFFAHIGYGAITFGVTVEVLPAKIRSRGTFITFMNMSTFIFIVLRIFPLLLDAYGFSITIWLCASVCLLSFIYLAVFLPETMAKSMDAE